MAILPTKQCPSRLFSSLAEISYVRDNPVDDSNMNPSLRGPYSAAFPVAAELKNKRWIEGIYHKRDYKLSKLGMYTERSH